MSKTILSRLALGVLLSTVMTACEQQTTEAPEVVRPVRILTISALQAGDTISYPGEILGVQNAEIAFEVPGRLVELPAESGQFASLKGRWLKRTPREVMLASAKLDPVDGAPGAAFRYSSVDYFLAALAVERASGTSYREFMRTRLFEPLGMSRTLLQDERRLPRVRGKVRRIGTTAERGRFVSCVARERIRVGLSDTRDSACHGGYAHCSWPHGPDQWPKWR